MNSIGDHIDKLVIENIKIFMLRNELHGADVGDQEYVEKFIRMNGLNANRSTLINLLDGKIDRVLKGEEKNALLKVFKTY